MNQELLDSQVFSAFADERKKIDAANLSQTDWLDIKNQLLDYHTNDPTGETVQTLNQWMGEGDTEDICNEYVRSAIHTVEAYDNGTLGEIKVAGHDMENNIHVSAQILRMLQIPENDMSPYAMWELSLSSVLHNWGRLLGHNDSVHQIGGAYLTAQMMKHLSENQPMSPHIQLISKRIITNILEHSGKNTGDIIGDLVRASDRMQQIAPTGPFRELLYDVGKDGGTIFPHINPAYDQEVPMYQKDNERKLPISWLNCIEFMARNLYPFYDETVNKSNPPEYKAIMESTQTHADKRRAYSVALLMVLTDFDPHAEASTQSPLARQTFAPELGGTDEALHWSKQKIPEHIWQNALWEYDQFQKTNSDTIVDALIQKNGIHTAVTHILEATNSYVDPAVMETISKAVNACSPTEQHTMLKGLLYCFDMYKKGVHEEYEIAKSACTSPNVSEQILGEYVKNYFENNKFSEQSNFSRMDKLFEKLNSPLKTELLSVENQVWL